jgi:hypothetical protein
MKVFSSVLLTAAVGLLFAQGAWAASYQIGPVSQQVSPGKASVGASVEASGSSPGASGARNVSSESRGGAPTSAPSEEEGEVTVPSRANGEACQTLPASAVPCYGVVALPPEEAETRGAAPPVNPAALAEATASRLALGPGRIQVSPSAHTAGLTGAASWFWIEPAPAVRSLSVSLRGERVTVSASAASVRWRFGDSSELVAGPGVPYRVGSAPADAVRHVYQTRCLPGDQGHDPYVLSSCGPNGYAVEALVQWGISYTASGPVGGGGALPSRSTATSIAYPVGEARAFLTTAGGAG